MHLDDAIPAMQPFLLKMVADKTIPLPGDVNVITGGPPCQVLGADSLACNIVS
jgi:hypothetical protein